MCMHFQPCPTIASGSVMTGGPAWAMPLDVSSYYFGLVIPAYKNPEKAFSELPFRGRPGRIAARVISFYNRRLVTLGKRRYATGYLGRRNGGWRELYDGFVPDGRVSKLL